MSKLLNLSEGTYLALHGLALIASNMPKRINVKFIAKNLNASEAHLAKIFQKLSKAGIVTSLRGPQGGFILSKNPEEVNFLEVIEVFEGKIAVYSCPFGKSDCSFNTCLFDKSIHESSLEIYNRFKEMTLATLM
ncbi:MAG: hypothetical protein B6226_03605 [Candidatus Cloacimonetes bacterium 4572_65]|nr:MAG: hypothetical protein B6226_03605 [Candidatus Cloacimonetes bacterium 4572_65]